MEFDPLRRHARLPVEVVEEGDSDDARPSAVPARPPSSTHLLASEGGGALRAERRWVLGNHRARAAAQDQVVIEVGLGAVERDRCDQAVDAALSQEPSPLRKVGRAPEPRQAGDRGRASRCNPPALSLWLATAKLMRPRPYGP
jgi:hypothetical protein